MNTPVIEEPKPVTEEPEKEPERGEVTRMIEDWNNGDTTARDRLLSLVYGELRRMAHLRLMGERFGHTMLTGTLAGEVYLRLSKAKGVPCHNRKEFFSIAARLMRHALVEAARKRDSQRRGGDQIRLALENVTVITPELDLDLIALNQALEELEKLDKELSQVIELHYFAGFTLEQTAELLGVSDDTVKRRLKKAKAYLHKILTSAKGASDGHTTMETD